MTLGILKNMLARLQRYNAQEALERIWNDSGDENEDESYKFASEEESGEYEVASSSNEDNVGQTRFYAK